jgi:hypothetical protein
MLVGSGALAVASGVFFGLSLVERSAALDKCLPDRGYCVDDDGAAAVGRARAFAITSVVTLVGAVGLVVASAFVRDRPQVGAAFGVRRTAASVPFMLDGRF